MKKKEMDVISKYMAEIGRQGGKKSKRKLSKKQARDLNKIRWEKWRKEHGKG